MTPGLKVPPASLRVRHGVDEGIETVEVPLPAVITVAVLVCLDRTELLSGEISELRYMLKKLGDRENPRGDYSSNPSAEYKETALGT